MKSFKYFLMLCAVALSFAACEYDNYEGPEYYLKGNLFYGDSNIVFDSNVSILKACQKGYGKTDGGQSIRISDDGTFSQLFFEGDYWLTLANNQYPYMFPDFPSLGNGLGYDSVYMHIDDDQQINFECIPYYVFDEITYTPLDENSTTLDVTFTFRRNDDPRLPEDLPYVKRTFLYAGINQHVNTGTTLSKGSAPMKITTEKTVTIKLDLSKYRSSTYYPNNYRDYLYFRIGLQIDGLDGYYLLSKLVRVDNVPYVE